MTLYRVYFGRNIPGGGKVNGKAFESFLKLYVDHTLPGYTVFKANGSWKGEKEKTYVLEFIGRTYDSQSAYEIAENYKNIFSQKSVMVVEIPIDGMEF